MIIPLPPLATLPSRTETTQPHTRVRRNLPLQLRPKLVQLRLQVQQVERRQVPVPPRHAVVRLVHELGQVGVPARGLLGP